MRIANLPTRVATGAYIAHTGLKKWGAGTETAAGVHGMATGAYPALGRVDAPLFLRGLSVSEIAAGLVLLTPVVPAAVAGAVLTGFSGALVTMYLRTPALREPGSIWPSQQGTAVSKDVWMLGIGLGMLIDAASRRRRS